MKYVMGLDLGITSVGWAVINLDKKRIEDLGVRIFPGGERPKDGGSLNENRRLFRGQRRRLSRRRVRMRKIKELLVEQGLIVKEELENFYQLKKEDRDVWLLRVESLERKLEDKEWARVLTTLAKRRGYKSNRKDSKSEKEESGRVLKAIQLNQTIMENKNYRTVGEMLVKETNITTETLAKQALRNKADQYDHCVLREMLVEELKTLFEIQRNLGNLKASESFEKEYLEVFEYQKPFMTRELMEKMIGKCTFEKEEPRASKNSWTFERFMLLQKINNLTYSTGSEKHNLSQEEREKIITLAYEQREIKYTTLRKTLKLPDDARFTGLNYFIRKKKQEELTEEKYRQEVEKTTFVKLNGYHTLKEAFKKNEKIGLWKEFEKDKEKLDDVAETLSKSKTEQEIQKELEQIGLTKEEIAIVKDVNFDKYGHLSYKAMKKILSYLEEGKTYDKACELAGYNFKNETENPQKKLPPILQERGINPVMYRTVTQTRKIINAIIEKYGSPYEIHIEVARDLTKNRDERNKIQKKQEENRAENEKTKEYIRETFKIENPKPVDILKVKLWREQGGKSAYSLKAISPEQLFEDNYVQIDHALPFSRSFDDSYNNKVLVLTKENQDKRNLTPREYIKNEEEWEQYEAWIKTTYKYNPRKRENLLMKNFDEERAGDWRARNLVDTKYIARFLANYIKSNLLFEDYGEKSNRIKVKMIPGGVTTALRHYWGIAKKDRETDTHHAEDAVILACATNEFINKVMDFSKYKELYHEYKDGNYIDKETGEIVENKYKTHEMKRPWPEFKEELEARTSQNPRHDLESGQFKNYNDFNFENLKPLFVSRMPNRKITGQAHKETIYSDRKNGVVVIKTRLQELSGEDIKNICTKEEYKELYMSDKNTYDAIYRRMAEYNFKADKAFAPGYTIRKKAKNGEGTIVKSIKVPSKMNSGVKVQGGIAANGGMVRVDVFEKDGKYYLVPVYVADLVKGEIPNLAIMANKPKSEWTFMDESYNFKFSLFLNDLVYVKKGEKEILGYYVSTHSGTGAINLKSPNGQSEYEGIGVKTLDKFEKYEVDLLGNYYKVKKETRKGGKSRLKK